MIETSEKLPLRLAGALVLALAAACSVSASGQIPCVDNASCPSDYPVCQAGFCAEGGASTADVSVVGVQGKAAADKVRGTVVMTITARADSGVKSVSLAGGGKTFNADAGSGNGTYTFTVDTTTLADGDVAMTATVTPGDTTAAAKTSSAFTLHVDNTVPAFSGLATTTTPTAAARGMLVTLDVTPTEALASLSAHVTNSTSGVEGDMTDVSAPTGLTRHLGFAVNKDVDDIYTVTLIPTDLAGNVGTAVTRSFDVNKGAAFSGNHFAVTYTGSAGTTLITSGSSTGSYTFTIPTLGSAATATISDGTRSYSTSSAIKAASGGTLASVPVQAAGVTGSSILFTLTITNAAGGSVTQTAALIVVPAPSVSGFSLSPAAVTDGSPVTVTATIAGGRAFLSATGFASTEVQNGSTFIPPAGVTTSDFILTVKNSAGDPAGTVTSGTQSVASTPAPSFGTGTFAVTWTGSNSSLITAGSTSGQGTYTFTIPQIVAAGGTATIKDSNNVSYSNSANIKLASAGTLTNVTITAASVASPGTLTFTLAIGNTATTPAQVFQTAALTVVAAPSVSGFSLSPAIVTDGSPVTVTATISGSATLAGTGFPAKAVSNGSTIAAPAGTTTPDFVLTVKNAAGDTAGTAVAGPQPVQSVPAPAIGSFSATSAFITAGASPFDQTSLSWSFTGGACTTASNCRIDNTTSATTVQSALATSGTVGTGSLAVTSTFVLTVSNGASDSRATVSASVIVTNVVAPSFAGTFAITSTNPTTFTSPVNVAFQSPTFNNATSTGVIVDQTGTRIATIGSNSITTSPATITQPGTSTTYTLMIENQAGVQAVQSAFLEVRNTFSVGHTPPTGTAMFGSTATLLPNGKVFIAGGGTDTSCAGPSSAAFLYDEHNDSYASVGPMNHARCGHTATLLPDGTVLVVGGINDNHTEIYKPDSGNGTFVADVSVPLTTAVTRRFHTATLVTCSSVVLVAGGIDLSNSNAVQKSTEKLGLISAGTPTGNFSSANTVNLGDNRSQHTATFFPGGSTLACQTLIAGGSAGGSGKTADLYTANAIAVADTIAPVKNGANGSDMVVSRSQHTATLLNNGKVLLVGGIVVPSTTAVATAELFDPTQIGAAQISFAATSSLTNPRALHTSTKLSGGKVLIAGGRAGTAGSVELYSATGTAPALAGNMNASRSFHSSTPIFSGLFLMLGGNGTASADLFDPE